MPRRRFDPSNKYGRWTVRAPAERSISGYRRWHCRCDCGSESVVLQKTLLSGASRSCGCLSVEKFVARSVARNKKHGESKKTPEYRAWCHLRNRCNNPKSRDYQNYGGRGIAVCERWSSFENFLADMGRRPSRRHSVERNHVNGDYEPGNCCWATDKQQQNNKRGNIYILIRGERLTLRETCDRFEVEYKLVWGRMRRGWSLVDAMSLPRANNVCGLGHRPPPISTKLSQSDIRSALYGATTQTFRLMQVRLAEQAKREQEKAA
jgi:hypothetical protein